MAKEFSLKPLEDRVVVKPGDEQETTVSGIVIPDTAKEKPQEGEVVAVGPGRFEDGARVPLDVKVGDKVIYSSTAAPRSRSGAPSTWSFRPATCSPSSGSRGSSWQPNS